jgi:hypothetical protein
VLILKNTIVLFTTLKSINHLKNAELGFEYRFANLGNSIVVSVLNLSGKEVNRLNLIDRTFTPDDLMDWVAKTESVEKVIVDNGKLQC